MNSYTITIKTTGLENAPRGMTFDQIITNELDAARRDNDLQWASYLLMLDKRFPDEAPHKAPSWSGTPYEDLPFDEARPFW